MKIATIIGLYMGLYRDHYKDPLPHSPLSTRKVSASSVVEFFLSPLYREINLASPCGMVKLLHCDLGVGVIYRGNIRVILGYWLYV